MFDPLAATAGELQELLQDGKLTSVDIVDVYLKQIEKHNHNGLKLNAIISVAPRDILVKRAERLDQERRNGATRSPLQGIPIVVKDSIITDVKLGMPTTNGSLAYKVARATRNAECIERLVQAGMIILGKANLTEASGMKSPSMTPGWSPAGGQTQTPYVFPSNREGDKILGNSRPGGSSSGSAMAVAAGFAPLALGTEAVGSLITPANRAALYGLKLPPGVSPNDGIFGISETFDGVGGMAKSADDLKMLTALLMGQSASAQSLAEESLSVGFVDPREWQLPEAICAPDELDAKQMVIFPGPARFLFAHISLD
jgi:amidase